MNGRVVITEGDAAGVGPEIILKALADPSVREAAHPVVCGSARDFDGAFSLLIKTGFIKERFPLEIHDCCPPYTGRAGEVSAEAGKNAFNCVENAVSLISSCEAAALCTAPVNKQSLKAGGVPFIGHTEMLGSLTGSDNPLTVFETGNLRIFFFTRHIRFSEIASSIVFERLYPFILRCDKENLKLSDSPLPLAVAALNPHGGDNGLMGDEENIISEAVAAARAAGANVIGPVPADSVFALCLKGCYSAVLSLYHDQGHIAAKTLDFDGTISLTAGLPFMRTSPDHGTAFDIAHRGIARERAMRAAILRAAEFTKKGDLNENKI